jgi:glucokinase
MKSALIGDIGATNARFALLEDGQPQGIEILNVADHPSLGTAIEAYLAKIPAADRPRLGALAVAGPVTSDFLSFTNHPWSFSIKALTRDLRFERLEVVNDFVAAALGVLRLRPEDRRQVGHGDPTAAAPIAVIGPGSGLGVSSLAPCSCNGRVEWMPLPGEGGHVTLSTVTLREAAIVDRLHRAGYDHVSAERLVSGPGLATLYTTLSMLDGIADLPLEPSQVTAGALNGEDPHAVEAVEIFCALLGTVAGNLALSLGARGGVYIAGGIVPRLGPLFDRSQFRTRFTAKGRMQAYLDPIPTYVITHKLPAFLGLAELLERSGSVP